MRNFPEDSDEQALMKKIRENEVFLRGNNILRILSISTAFVGAAFWILRITEKENHHIIVPVAFVNTLTSLGTYLLEKSYSKAQEKNLDHLITLVAKVEENLGILATRELLSEYPGTKMSLENHEIQRSHERLNQGSV